MQKLHLTASAIALIAAAAPAAALAQTAQVQELVVTGTRLPANEFTSASPIQVLSIDSADARGILDTGRFLQGSSLAAGSLQVNPAVSYALVEPGGTGVSTVSLRGLGANRSLVLLNGRRVGPAGTRGEVSSVDLNTIPMSAIARVDILKDGASSIYGSDAVAGVVNIVTRQDHDGGSLNAAYSAPFEGGGEELNLSGDWGKSFERGWVHVSADYYRQEELAQGDRDAARCASQYVFNPASGQRDDVVDPRTGQPTCLDEPWGQVYVYTIQSLDPLAYEELPGRYQYDFGGNLGQFIPPIPPAEADNYPAAPDGFFLVGQDADSLRVMNANHPLQDRSTLIPQLERKSVFLEGAYDVMPQVQAYGELLLTRRESEKTGFRTFWPIELSFDPFEPGFSGFYGLRPVVPTSHAGFREQVDYTRLVAGLRGTVPGTALDGWKWDVFVQHSRSDGRYTTDQILNDAIESQSFRFGSCVGFDLPVSGRPCMDISFTDPRVLGGDLNADEQAFLFGVETGKTVYTQDFVEGSVSGDALQLPAGPLAVALGFHYRKDEIRDVPGAITLANNAWGRSGAGITAGSDMTGEVFGEVGVPLIADAPLAKKVDLTLSTRWTDVQSSGNQATYKAGLNWALTPEYRLRATWGTSFRAPALYELYLAQQTSFLDEGVVDPCVSWGARLSLGLITQRTADNCAAAGAPSNLASIGSATIVEGGGLGALKPETSEAATFGVVWTPAFAPLSVAVDYFDIRVKDEVTSLGAQIPLACYNSPNFPADPVCGLLDRNPGSHRIDTIRASFINIAQQKNRGVDLTVNYRQPLPLSLGDMSLDGRFTWQLKDEQTLFAGFTQDLNGLIGEPDFVGDVNLAVRRGPWTATWASDLIGHQGNYAAYGGDTVSILGVTHKVKAHAEFTAFHSISLRRDVDDWSLLVGVANVFDEQPPAVTTVGTGLGQYNIVGSSVFSSQYTEGYLGRRGFVRISRGF